MQVQCNIVRTLHSANITSSFLQVPGAVCGCGYYRTVQCTVTSHHHHNNSAECSLLTIFDGTLHLHSLCSVWTCGYYSNTTVPQITFIVKLVSFINVSSKIIKYCCRIFTSRLFNSLKQFHLSCPHSN